ncbi:hypothetical protein BTUL_0336g00020 [Botrytis tulipae]|uniref:AB hydrolase-1 domain-containing protein n=1 Tax=Botrytis tulipae TaxID=87230 RepID=A0A4Z1E901_9HELO|nr:hypothetical protein BTUL_0336g00020 [Botrytis tulipae]
MSSSFVVVICHGSYHTPEPYRPFQDALKAAGIESYCPQLPSSDLTKLNVEDVTNPDYDGDIPTGGYPQPSDDLVIINELLQDLIVKGEKNVIKRGLSGGIIGIFYACAFLIPVGDSVNGFFQPKDGSSPVVPAYCKFHAHGMNGVASTVEIAKYFFDGLDEAQAKKYESTLTASPILKTNLHNDAYTALPCTYLITENDLALPTVYQEGMIALQNSRPGVSITIIRCPSGHSPHLTWIEGFVAAVREFGKELPL